MQETEEIAIEEGEIVEDTTAADANDSVPISEEPSASVEDDAEVNSSEEDYELGDCVLCVTEGGEERPGLLMKAFHNKGSAPRAVTVKWLLDAAAWSRLTQKPEDVELEENELILSSAPAVTLPGENIKNRISILSKDEYAAPMASTKGSKDERVFFCQCGLDLETGTLIENLDWERVKISKGFFLVISDRMEQRTSRKRTRSVSERRASKAVSSKKIAQDGDTDEQSDDGDFAPEKEDEDTAVDDDEDELSEEEEEDELEEEEQNDKSENVSTRSSKSLKKPGNKSIQKKKAPKNVDDQAESDEDMPFKHQTRRGPKGRPPRTTDFRFVDPRLKEIYLLSQPYVVTAEEYKIDSQKKTPKNRRPVNKYEKARERLYLSWTPDLLPCREGEFQEIYLHLESLLQEGSGSCTYISGVPGTGKTATVHSVINALKSRVKKDEIPAFKYIELNGMKMTDPTQAYQLLWEKLTGSRVSAQHAMDLLDKRFSSTVDNIQPCVVLMDELDLLLTKNQKVIYNFFEWPNRPQSKLIVVAIANTMDLPERTLSNKISSRLELKRITFEQYTYAQLIEIVKSRLSNFNVFDSDAIEFCARKVGSVSGDARRALAICRRAIEKVEESTLDRDSDTTKSITRDIVTKVINEMFLSPSIQAICKATLHQRIFLVAVFRISRNEGKPEVTFRDVVFEHQRISQFQNLAVPTRGDLVSICSFLNSFRLILCENNKIGDPTQKLRLNVSEEDLMSAVKKGTDKKTKDPEAEFLRKLVEA